jgi:hypothetical protein
LTPAGGFAPAQDLPALERRGKQAAGNLFRELGRKRACALAMSVRKHPKQEQIQGVLNAFLRSFF